jgi:transcriptional regulator with XRE-family HTH domain
MNNTPRKRVKTPTRATKAPLKSDPNAVNGSLPKPNVDDPLSETARHRRIWAAYLSRGLTRKQFAQELGTNYHTVNRWDAGAATISLDMLQRASELLHYTMDELCFGKQAPPERRAPAVPAAPAAAPPARAARHAVPAFNGDATAPLNEVNIRALLDAQRVDPATRAAFGEHTVSPAGRYQSFTADYVVAWCAAYAASQDGNAALGAAVTARAVTEAAAAGIGPVTADALRAALLRPKP